MDLNDVSIGTLINMVEKAVKEHGINDIDNRRYFKEGIIEGLNIANDIINADAECEECGRLVNRGDGYGENDSVLCYKCRKEQEKDKFIIKYGIL